MIGLTITDMDEHGRLLIDLRDILAVLGRAATASRWKLEGVEADGSPAGDMLERLSDTSAAINGDELVRLASKASQIIDGQFSEFEDDSDVPWIVIAAVDSAAYDVISNQIDLLNALKNAFESAEYIPGMEPS